MRIGSPLTTERLVLDMLDPAALAPAYLQWMNDKDITRFLEARFLQHTPESLAAFVSAMNHSTDNLLLGIFLKGERRHIGNIKLGPILQPHLRADVGLVVGDRSCWGKGYATEAITALTAYALGSLRLHRVTAGMYSENLGSYKAFRKADYSEDGRLRDYWLLDGRWQDEIILHKLANRQHG